ncbi:tetratricopeptide repeat protein [Salidesulfovibrio brasiliensis]|uniref:tetratricopeptide repeat protein n=1 Tax=Salidesulfovibrio brasiliensis TaxID=221711 RepID=UPI0006D1B5E3|nr:tetratricopeptide repeat protein [Salidesulfovibrio brasiliensis]
MLEQPRKALADFDRLVELHPGMVNLWLNRARCRAGLKMREEALADYDKVLELGMKDISVYKERGIMFSELGRKKEAVESFTKAMAIGAKDAMLFVNRGAAYMSLGDTEAAIRDYSKAVMIDPANSGAFSNRALAFIKLGHHQEARADLREAAVLDSKRGVALAILAKLYATTDKGFKDIPHAMNLAQKAVAMNNAPFTLQSLALVHAAAGDFDKAVSVQTEALNALRESGMDTAYYERTLAMYRKGEVADPFPDSP